VKRANLELHIEELILEGVAPRHRGRIGRAVRLELTRLLAEEGAPPLLRREGRIARLDGSSIAPARGETPEATGNKLARAVYGGLKR